MKKKPSDIPGGSYVEGVDNTNVWTKSNTRISKWNKAWCRSGLIRRYRRGDFDKATTLILVNMLGVDKKQEHMPAAIRKKDGILR